MPTRATTTGSISKAPGSAPLRTTLSGRSCLRARTCFSQEDSSTTIAARARKTACSSSTSTAWATCWCRPQHAERKPRSPSARGATTPSRTRHKRCSANRLRSGRFRSFPGAITPASMAQKEEEPCCRHDDRRPGGPSPVVMATRGCGFLPRHFASTPTPRSDGRPPPGVRRTFGPPLCSSCDASG